MSKRKFYNAIILYEMIGFGFILLFLWLDEILDLPHYLLGTLQTPINIPESIMESIIILVVGTLCIIVTFQLLKKIKTLEGLLPICASCKKIRDQKGDWHQIETYIMNHSGALFSHGLCTQCLDKLYGDQEWYQRKRDFIKSGVKKNKG